MIRKKNNKGFTLVELLVAVAILGIITGMSIPIITNIKNNNETKKFDIYGKSLITAAKLYKDSYEEDLFGHKTSGCSNITIDKLKEKKLIHDFPDENISCISDSTFVKIIKLKNQYGYSYSLGCGKKSSSGTVEGTPIYYFHTTSKNEKRVIEALEKPAPEDLCNPLGAITISANPSEGLVLAESYKSKIIIRSSTGIENANIQYSWSESTDFHSITDWKALKVNIPNITNQTEKVLNGVDVVIQTSNIAPPAGQPGTYYLYLKVNSLKDLGGEYWKAEDGGIYTKFGPFNVANKYTLKYDDDNKALCDNEQIIVYVKKNETKKWGTLCTPTKVGYDFNGWNKNKTGGESTKVTEDTIANTNLTAYAQWSPKKLKVTFDCNGGSTNQEQTFTYGVENQQFNKLCTKTGYTLLGWAGKSDATEKNWNVASNVTDNWIDNNSPTKTIYAVWDKASYTLSYDKNQGDGGSTASTTCVHGENCTVATNGFTRTGYTFTGWNTKADGTGTNYASGATIKITSNTTLYAKWRINVVKIRYKVNSGETLDTGTGQGFTNVNGFATKGGSNVIHTVKYGESIGSAGLADYNNKSWLNISRDYNCIAMSGIEWKSTSNTYSQSTVYTASQLCSTIATGDCTLDLSVNWGKIVTIKYNMNGGSLASSHGDSIGHSGQWITVSGNTEALKLYNGCATSSGGLANYNNSTYINIKKPSGKNNPTAKKEWNTASNGSGTDYDQAKVYRGSDFCNAKTTNCTRNLYVHWK